MNFSHKTQNLKEVFLLFLKLGITAFGGPAAHIAMMHDETVKRRKWLSEQEFLDLVGATNLIPGPNSTEMAIHLGYQRAGWLGLILGGAAFIFPAMVIVLLLAVVYTRYGSTPQAEWLLYGVKPVVIAVILQALFNLGKKALKDRITWIVTILVVGLYFLGLHELILLFGGGLLVMVLKNPSRINPKTSIFAILPLFNPIRMIDPISTPTLSGIFFLFLKIGSVLYGSGYVLLAFLRSELVLRFSWLSDAQLIDAVAIGQLTPGPVFTTATFIGYLLADVPGALLATLGIFLPSFIFVFITNPIIPKLRNSPWFGSLLDGVNAVSLGLMAVVTFQLGSASLIDPVSILLAVISAVLLFRFKVNTTWLILGGALVGYLRFVG